MKKLTEYKKNGRTWIVQKRVNDIAMAVDAGNPRNHEVFIVQSHNGMERHGSWIEPAEYTPSNEEWGSKGWSFMDRKSALRRFVELVVNGNDKP
jgi:hypothetical protein